MEAHACHPSLKPLLLILPALLLHQPLSADSTCIRVHFLYGSKPARGFKDREAKWFGGIHGGHTGIGIGRDSILSFLPNGDFHVFQHKTEIKGAFFIHTPDDFYRLFPADAPVKKLIIEIPVSAAAAAAIQKKSAKYLRHAPYDYAFFGMRCGGAAYDLLSAGGIVKTWKYRKTWKRIFYPKKLRKKLLRRARQMNWKLIREAGSPARKWEKD